MDGENEETGGWISSTPGVHQRADAAPGSGLAGRWRRRSGPQEGDWVGCVRVAAPADVPGRRRRAVERIRGSGSTGRLRAGLLALAVLAVVLVSGRLVQPGQVAPSGAGPAGSLALGAQAPGAGSVPGRPGPPAGATASVAPEAAAPGGLPEASAAPADGMMAADAPAAAVLQGTDWWAVMAELDERRSEVLASGDPGGLGRYAQPGSPAWRADQALLDELAAQDLRPAGLTSEVMAIERAELTGSEVRLQIVDARSAYELVDTEGTVVSQVDPAGPARWSVVLASVDSGPEPGWRVVSVEVLTTDEASP